MAISFTLDPPQKWLVLRLAALNRASRLIRRMHLGPSLALPCHSRTGKFKPALRVISRHPDGSGLNDFVVFKVEETMFNVHMSLFLLKIWSPVDSVNSTGPENITADPVILSDTAENFRFFLWDLHTFPYELVHLHTDDSNVIQVVDRLLRITETAQKHNLSVLEIHALESLRQFVLSPYFRSVSSIAHCRALKIALSSNQNQNLLDDLCRRLTYHILRRKSTLADDSDLISLVEGDSRLKKIRGAVYYRQLIDIERRLDDRAAEQPELSPVKDMERRMRFLAAHVSLSALSARVCASPPLIPCCDCSSHSACLLAWEETWTSAVAASETRFFGSVDILGRLRHMMPLLKRMVPAATTISIECGLAALEAVVALRDDIMDSLLNHFVG
ncbi:hypothetical protein B0H12DRAFT_1072216 [Mycena haematopus]|nr:hypothetical protein B0H12DRAFT_1072216 [Mycena haematopus]